MSKVAGVKCTNYCAALFRTRWKLVIFGNVASNYALRHVGFLGPDDDTKNSKRVATFFVSHWKRHNSHKGTQFPTGEYESSS